METNDCPSELNSGVLGCVKSIRDFADTAIRIQNENHVHFDTGYPIYFVSLLHIADRLEREYNKEISELKRKLSLSQPVLEDAYSINMS